MVQSLDQVRVYVVTGAKLGAGAAAIEENLLIMHEPPFGGEKSKYRRYGLSGRILVLSAKSGILQ